MPYITKSKRKPYEESISRIVDELNALDDNEIQGHLNYIFYCIIKRYITKKGIEIF